MVILSHPTGNTFVRALLHELESTDLLEAFYTTLAFHSQSSAMRMLPAAARAEASRRSYDVPIEKLKRFPMREVMRHLAPKIGLSHWAHDERGPASWVAVYHDLDRRVAAQLLRQGRGASTESVYAYEDGALHTFEAAKRVGVRRFYELPIAYWETSLRLLSEEAERYPAWKPVMRDARASSTKLRRKTRELELAQVVVVPSQFVFDSLPAAIRQNVTCVVAPFGSPVSALETSFDENQKLDAKRPLRVLFAGSMTQRKGLADLFAAMRLLDRSDVELVVLGSPIAPLEFYRAQNVPFRYEAPRPHAQVLELMKSCDVLTLPSIVEGRALVQQEAMACGLPLLVTPNTGGQDLVVEGETGWLVPIRAPEQIAEKIAWMADNREQLHQMRAAARAKAALYTWEAYAQKIVGALKAELPH